MKKFYSLIAAALIAAPAVSAHNVDIYFSPAFMNAVNVTAKPLEGHSAYPECPHGSGPAVWLEVMYFPGDYQPAKNKNEQGTGVVANVDKTLRSTYEASLTGGEIDGAWVVPTHEQGMAYATVPAQYYKDGALTDVPAAGSVRFRIAYYGSGFRPGDTDQLYVYDTKSIFCTASAPAGTKMNAYVVAASAGTFKESIHPSGDQANGTYFHTVFYDFPDMVANNTITDIQTTGDAYGATNLFEYRRAGKDENGFPCKYFDVVFRGLKAGDKVGLCNYQTVYDGYTPHGYDFEHSAVETLATDANNAPVEYFNLQGIRVENPQAGGLYIRRQGSDVKKVVM